MQIDTRTQLCGLLGFPVEHSFSPAIHNAAFQALGLNYVYLAFPVEQIGEAVRGIRALGNLRGFSVTIPHKVAVIPHLDDVEATARHIGSINTIVVEQGRLMGYNTDASGALRALTNAAVPLRGERVVMLGSGGAARAIAFGLALEGGIRGLTLLGIDEKERRGLAEDLRRKTSLDVHEAPLTRETLAAAIPSVSLMLQCTPVGMHPHVDDTPVGPDLLRPHLTVMDIVYNPVETRLLRDAKSAGCRTVSGLDMFLNQAVGQFELWTGRPAPVDVMRRILAARFA